MNRTRWLIVISVLAILAVDTVLAVKWGKQATISVQLTQWGHEYPFVSYLFGVLTGHLWTQDYWPPNLAAGTK